MPDAMRRGLALLLLVLLATAWRQPASPVVAARVIVLVGGAGTEGPGRHEYAAGIALLGRALRAAGAGRVEVRSFPDGWPDDPRAFDGAATVVLYCDGMARHPFANAVHRRQWEALMRKGTGLVALHQASTVLPDEDFGLLRGLGAVRRGMFDRTTETAALRPAAQSGALIAGLQPFVSRDEFYPTLERSNHGGRVIALLEADLHPQFRAGAAVLDGHAERDTIAWAFERDGGGRSIGYSGGHFLAALQAPPLRGFLVRAILWTAGEAPPPGNMAIGPGAGTAASPTPGAARTPHRNGVHAVATFQHDRGRSGWFPEGVGPTPVQVADDFGLAWESPPLTGLDGEPARLYASPLFVPQVRIADGPQRGDTLSMVIVASNLGDVASVNAVRSGDLAAGRILWRTRLGPACRLQPAPLDGVATGILSTPIVDRDAGRVYVTHCDPVQRWQAYALDLSTGAILPGWPVRLDEARLNTVNANAGPTRVPPRRRFDFRVQRGALNLSPDGGLLYVVFGESETGWLVAVDTRVPGMRSAFAAAAMPHRGSGGIWGAGGPAVDEAGQVYVATGSGFDGFLAQDHDWTQSVLRLAPPVDGPFLLRGTYTPFNHCQTAAADIDLGSGGVSLAPRRRGEASGAATPRWLALGGKQGNAYLLDRDALPGRLDRRPSCTADAGTDGSLLPPGAQPQFGGRGPLNVFGPYSERDAAMDIARARSVPAWFRDASGRDVVFLTGTSKAATGSSVSVPPSVVKLEVVRDPHGRAWLRVAARDARHALGNPGSPVVTSRGGEDALLWVLDENAPRSAALAGDAPPQPVLYALDPADLREVWRSAPGVLSTSGKYNAPAFGAGLAFVGSDRLQAFGPGGRFVRAPEPRSPQAPFLAHAAVGSAPPGRASTTPAGAPDAAANYAQRCAACHDHAEGNIPPRAVLATYDRARIVRALAEGVMRPHAAGLSASQIDALAEFLQ
jgi:outer membrane protein assembly factor BamB